MADTTTENPAPTVIEIDCSTGISTERPMTADEIAAQQKMQADIAAQQASPSLILQTKSGFSPLVKITKSSFFGKLVGGIAKAGFLASVVGVIAAPFTGGASLALAAAGLSTSYVSGVAAVAAEVVTAGRALTVPAGYKPMSKDQALKVLGETQKQLESILAKDCE